MIKNKNYSYVPKVIVSIILVWLCGAILIFILEPETFINFRTSLWWAIVSMTTVGYGDIVPITIGGKIFTSFISFIGIGVVSIPTALLASSLTNLLHVNNGDKKNANEREEI